MRIVRIVYDLSFAILTQQITEKKDEFFTLLVLKDITSRHSGQYTCFATNSAAKINYTSELLVKGIVH